MLCHLKVRRNKFRIYRCHPVHLRSQAHDAPDPLNVEDLTELFFQEEQMAFIVRVNKTYNKHMGKCLTRWKEFKIFKAREPMTRSFLPFTPTSVPAVIFCLNLTDFYVKKARMRHGQKVPGSTGSVTTTLFSGVVGYLELDDRVVWVADGEVIVDHHSLQHLDQAPGYPGTSLLMPTVTSKQCTSD